MSKPIKVLAFAGSTRRESFNRKLLAAAGQAAGSIDLVWTALDLNDYPLPLYNGDLETEHGLPPEALALKQVIQQHDALVIVSPEYNASVTPLLKNTIDWLSRPGGDDDPGPVLSEKPTALFSASPGGLGGLRALNHLRAILQNLSVFVIPRQFALPSAHEAFNDDGSLKSSETPKAITAVLEQLKTTAQALKQ